LLHVKIVSMSIYSYEKMYIIVHYVHEYKMYVVNNCKIMDVLWYDGFHKYTNDDDVFHLKMAHRGRNM
jgi:hypothetical protein